MLELVQSTVPNRRLILPWLGGVSSMGPYSAMVCSGRGVVSDRGPCLGLLLKRLYERVPLKG